MKRSKSVLTSYLLAGLMFLIVNMFLKDMIVSIIFAVLTFIILQFHIQRKLMISKEFRKSVSDFSHLANSLVMQMSVTPNASQSLKEVGFFLPSDQQEIINNDELLMEEKFNSLEPYYEFHLFKIFKEILVLYENQGGNIIQMSVEILEQIDVYQKNLEEKHLDNGKKISEVLMLWVFSLVSLIYVKNILKVYYDLVLTKDIFKGMLIIYFALFIISLISIGKNYINLKGEDL